MFVSFFYSELSLYEFFFGFALYRSGTAFLANLLNNIDHEIIVQHEPNVNDYYYYGREIQTRSVTLKITD